MKKHPQTNDEKLDALLYHVERIDKRDQLRLWGGFVRNVIALIPAAIFVMTIWYVYNNWDKLLDEIAAVAAKQAQIVTEQGTDALIKNLGTDTGLLKQLEQLLP